MIEAIRFERKNRSFRIQSVRRFVSVFKFTRTIFTRIFQGEIIVTTNKYFPYAVLKFVKQHRIRLNHLTYYIIRTVRFVNCETVIEVPAKFDTLAVMRDGTLGNKI